jgi:hypothetical protein
VRLELLPQNPLYRKTGVPIGLGDDVPRYLRFEPILTALEPVLQGAEYAQFGSADPNNLSDVNYNFVANKDGRSV